MTHGGPLRVVVNVSPVQLKQADFVDTVCRAVEGIAAAKLDLEITETMVMDDVAANVCKIQALRDRGTNVAIDDFGTGYSSLAYLTQLPVNALKIDCAFVATMTSDAQSMTLVSTIISLSRARPEGHRGGRRDRRAGEDAAPAPVRRAAGLPLQQAAEGYGGRGFPSPLG